MWRCFPRSKFCQCIRPVFSTYVEVFPLQSSSTDGIFCFLHVCGGVSSAVTGGKIASKFSPRMWRCFYHCQTISPSESVFSTYVEVFPFKGVVRQNTNRFLHVCGGVSLTRNTLTYLFLFSPRMWRCFLIQFFKVAHVVVFSTYVEVFLLNKLKYKIKRSFLHVCGGVSKSKQTQKSKEGFSPRMWRCFYDGGCVYACLPVFSTYVEVFL